MFFKPGQFGWLTLRESPYHIKEHPFSFSSSANHHDRVEVTIKELGDFPRTIKQTQVGETAYLDGPYGVFSVDRYPEAPGYIFVAGGIGLPPLRSLIKTVFDRRPDYGKIKILYGAKTPDEICFKEELKAWQAIPDTELLLTVDEPDDAWKENVGVVTTLWDKTDMDASGSAAFVCGPPIMIKFSVQRLQQSGFKARDIYMSLERYMKCGIGKCGHCNIGGKLVCIDGPIFSFSQIQELPEKERII